MNHRPCVGLFVFARELASCTVSVGPLAASRLPTGGRRPSTLAAFSVFVVPESAPSVPSAN